MAVDGVYKVQMTSPRGTDEATLTLASSGAELSGTFAGQMGAQPFSGGTIDGGKVAWNIKVQGPMGEMNLAFAGNVDGDNIEGTVQFGAFGSGSFKGAKG